MLDTKLKFTKRLKKIGKIYNKTEGWLVNLGPASAFLCLGWASIFVKNGDGKTVNPILVVDKGGGKTELLLNFVKNNKELLIKIYDKVTASGLGRLYKEKPELFKDKGWVFDDMLSFTTTLDKPIFQELQCLFNELLTAGRYGKLTSMERVDIRARIQVTCGIARNNYNRHRSHLLEQTFLDRFVIFHLFYMIEEEKEGARRIACGEVKEPKLKLPKLKKAVIRWNNDFNDEIEALAWSVKPKLGNSLVFRPLNYLRYMVKASALFNGRRKVHQDDLNLVKCLSPYLENPLQFSSLAFAIYRFIESNPWPRFRDIRDEFEDRGYSESTIRRYVNQLRKIGLIQYQKVPRPMGGCEFEYMVL